MPQIEVTFDVDANGILNVKARDKATCKEQSIRIEASSGLKKEDIERMKKEAEMNASDDAKKKESVEVKNIAEQMIYTAEKAIKDNKEKISAEIVKGVEDKIADLKTAIVGTDANLIKTKTDALSTEMQKIGEAMSKANPTGTCQTGGNEEKKPEDNVKDAEYKENK
jgi:molecular chaperone DnaK